METPKLEAQKRDILGKNTSKLREQGYAPAVIYGKSIQPQNLMVFEKDFLKLYKNAGDNTVIDLSVKDSKEKHKVLIQNVHFSPFKEKVNNIEFLVISLTETVNVDVPLVFINTEESEKLGGMLVKSLHEIEIETLPSNIPHEISIDCSALKEFGTTIYVKDLKLDKNIKVITSEDSPIVSFDEPKKEKAPEDEPTTEEAKEETKPSEETKDEPESKEKEN